MAVTPGLAGMHSAERLRPQSAPALAQRSLTLGHLDEVLLTALLARWEDYFAARTEKGDNLRLFRALEMARAASRMPGGTDATFHDEGRAVALWVSAFEILSYDGHSDLGRVLSLLRRIVWRNSKLKIEDHQVTSRRIQTNLAGAIYAQLYRTRNDFLHGNPVTGETLRIGKSQKLVRPFAAPLFRLALTAFLDLQFSETLPSGASDQEQGRLIAKRVSYYSAQRLTEDAILTAEEPQPATGAA